MPLKMESEATPAECPHFYDSMMISNAWSWEMKPGENMTAFTHTLEITCQDCGEKSFFSRVVPSPVKEES